MNEVIPLESCCLVQSFDEAMYEHGIQVASGDTNGEILHKLNMTQSLATTTRTDNFSNATHKRPNKTTRGASKLLF